jgi:hypothetical protein
MLLSPRPTSARRTSSPTCCRLVRSPCSPPHCSSVREHTEDPVEARPACLSFKMTPRSFLFIAPSSRALLEPLASPSRSLKMSRHRSSSSAQPSTIGTSSSPPLTHISADPASSRVCIIDLAPFRLLGAPCFCVVCCAWRIHAIRVCFGMSPAQLFAATRTNFSTSACSPSTPASETLCSYSVRSLANICSVILIKSVCV